MRVRGREKKKERERQRGSSIDKGEYKGTVDRWRITFIVIST